MLQFISTERHFLIVLALFSVMDIASLHRHPYIDDVEGVLALKHSFRLETLFRLAELVLTRLFFIRGQLL